MVTGLLTALLGLSGPVAATPTLATLAPQALAIALAPHGAGRPATTSQRNRRSRQPSEDDPEGTVDEDKSPPDQEQAPEQKPEEPKPKASDVKGRVMNGDGEGLPGSKVTVVGPRNDTVWTDSQGSFHFTGPPGDYSLTVEASEGTRHFAAKIVKGKLAPDVFTIKE